MGLFSFFGKESKTTNNTTNTYTDNSSNAAEGAVAAGAGANVQIVTADKDVALGAIAGNQNVSLGAIAGNQNVSQYALQTTGDTAKNALIANRDVSLAGIDTTARVAADAINSIVGLREVESREKIDSLQSANLALTTNQGAISKLTDLTSAALQRSQDPGSDTSKIALYVGGAIAVALILALFSKKGKPA